MKKETYWLFGLPCSGKTTLAREIVSLLESKGEKTIHLDGDEIRKGINSDLGFSKEDRKENIRRIAHISELFNRRGLNVVASFISPSEEHRETIRKTIEKVKIIYIECPLEECLQRDVKRMYAQAREGKIKNFTGIGDLFEEPIKVDLRINTFEKNVASCIEEIKKIL